jgi:hypothetical protein
VEEQRLEVVEVGGGASVSFGAGVCLGLPVEMFPPLAGGFTGLGDHGVDQDHSVYWDMFAGQWCTEAAQGLGDKGHRGATFQAAATMRSQYFGRPAAGSAPKVDRHCLMAALGQFGDDPVPVPTAAARAGYQHKVRHGCDPVTRSHRRLDLAKQPVHPYTSTRPLKPHRTSP